MKKEYSAKLYTFIGLVILATVISVMSMFSNQVEDVRILGVHTTPTVKPTAKPTTIPTAVPTTKPTTEPTIKPTVGPSPFPGCVSNGTAVSSPSLCCSKSAVYIWSSYVCGDAKTNITATVTPKKTTLVTPTISFVEPSMLVPTSKLTSCKAGTLDIECVDSTGRKCKWYRNENCLWSCGQECVSAKRCSPGKLNNICTNNSGQICFEYQNSDCSIDCSQNCKDKEATNNVVRNAFNSIGKFVKIGSCSTGKDYNNDGVANSLDIVFCKNNSSPLSKNINLVVDRINEGVPKLIDWVVTKMVGI